MGGGGGGGGGGEGSAIVIILFVLLLYIPVNSYGHGGMVSLPNHTFFLGKLEQVVIII